MLHYLPDMDRMLAAVAGAMARQREPLTYRKGPGRKTLYTHHKKIGRSCYRPHQGSQERLRRWKQLEKQRGDA